MGQGTENYYFNKIKMVDIGDKEDVLRVASAEGSIKLKSETIKRIKNGEIEKGDVLHSSEIAGILGAKKTPSLIPLCHSIPINKVNISFEIKEDKIIVRSEIRSIGKTGVEMEALTAVSIALLTIWDMVKKYEKDANGQYPETWINNIRVLNKSKEPL